MFVLSMLLRWCSFEPIMCPCGELRAGVVRIFTVVFLIASNGRVVTSRGLFDFANAHLRRGHSLLCLKVSHRMVRDSQTSDYDGNERHRGLQVTKARLDGLFTLLTVTVCCVPDPTSDAIDEFTQASTRRRACTTPRGRHRFHFFFSRSQRKKTNHR